MTDAASEQVLIAGAGPIGLACALSARRRGIDPLVIDAGAIANSIMRYPIGMVFFTTPERLEIGGHPLVCAGAKPTREEALKYYRGVVRAEGLRVRTHARLGNAFRDEDAGVIRCTLETRRGTEDVLAERLVLATGYFDIPRLLDVPGEDLPHVHHYFDEAHRSVGERVVVIGGKNSAAEAALQLFRAGAHVTLVYRRTAFRPSVKYWLKPDLENRIAAGEIDARLGAQVVRITEDAVDVSRADGTREAIPADRVYALTGYRPDISLFRKIGIHVDPMTGRPALDADTLATNVPGVFMVGSITRGFDTSEVFIENGRFDGEKIFGDAAARAAADRRYAEVGRPVGE